MPAPAAIAASFADFKIIRTRSVAQFVIEVPLEKADEALAALGGLPQPGTERPVAVARMTKRSETPTDQKRADAKERYATAGDMQKAVTRSVLLCKDKAFQTFLCGTNEEEARNNLCTRLGVQSRKDIGTQHAAYHAFVDLEDRFRTQQQVAAYPSHWTGARA